MKSLLIAAGGLALLLSACSTEASVVAGSDDAPAETADQSTTNETPSTSAPVEAASDSDALPYGPEPVYTQYQVDATAITTRNEPIGISYRTTDLFVEQSETQPNRLEYYAVGTETGPVGVWLQRSDEDVTVCGTLAEGCANGDRTGTGYTTSQARLNAFMYPGGEYVNLRIPVGFQTPSPNAGDGYWGWNIESDFTFQGYEGHCYVSAGEHSPFSGDPLEDTRFPAGDRMCQVFSGTGSSNLVSYDFGGDGTIEFQALEMRAAWTEADLVIQNNETSTATDQAAFQSLIDAWAAAEEGSTYPLGN